MAKRLIVTNNPVVAARYAGHSLSWQANYLQVLLAARDAIHQGQKLLMHPESGSVKPGQTPYRSLLLDGKTSALDLRSLEIIENALARYRHFSGTGRPLSAWSEQIKCDFQLIDLSLLREALQATDKYALTEG
ncbi:GrdX family protein [Yokenella regensburgei]|uniref:GrdX family protein n=1 Tax=Yokenella regensburgei TaxID=158877 RepID=UPI0035B1885A